MKKIFLLIIFLLFITNHAPAQSGQKPPTYNLSVSFNLQKHRVEGNSKITLVDDREVNVAFGKLEIHSVSLNGESLINEITKQSLQVKGEGILEIAFTGTIGSQGSGDLPQDHDSVLQNTIQKEHILLLEEWYPSIDRMAYYHLKASVPKNFTALSEAEEIAVHERGENVDYFFEFLKPISRISFLAGLYREYRDLYHGTELFVYTQKNSVINPSALMQEAKDHLKQYEQYLGKYPYKRLSFIENFIAGDFAIPTLILFDREENALPCMRQKSIEQLVLHQWFGGYVYIEKEENNWASGLTSYIADFLDEGWKEEGWKSRKDIMIALTDYAERSGDFFSEESQKIIDRDSRCIGCGKGKMLFHMLNIHLGSEAFQQGLKNFIQNNQSDKASWDDIREAFEETAAIDLEWFFEQWVNRTGLVSFQIKNQRVTLVEGVPSISFDVIQDSYPYRFELFVKISTDKGTFSEKLNITDEVETFEIPVSGNPVAMVFDENYDILRKLSEEEMPAVLARLQRDESKIAVIPVKARQTYKPLVEVLQEKGFEVKEDADMIDEDIKNSSLFLLGANNLVLKRLFGKWNRDNKPGLTIQVRKNPLNTERIVVLADTDTIQNVQYAAQRIFKYEQYSSMRFEGGQIIEKKTEKAARGEKIDLLEPAMAIKTLNIEKIDSIIETIVDKPIIYIGERHANYEDHKMQLKVIMQMHERGKKFAIGMEMFQRPFQQIIDKYLAGDLEEMEFLKQTEYFKRWKFDYNFYREIIDFARAKGIPVIALNISSDIIKKVSSDGLDALTDDERERIPEDMDMSDDQYRDMLQSVFKQHGRKRIGNFGYFYQSQILWDETMAHAAYEFLEENGDYQLVILAGVGHIMHGYGIPKRLHRLNGKEYVTLIPDIGTLDDTISDYIYVMDHAEKPLTLKLGVTIKEKDGLLKVEKVVPGSVAKNTGVKKGDILLSLDNWKTEDIEDVKIFMSAKKRGEPIRITVKRKKFLFGYEEVVLSGVI
jgi:uncharacterized iron-regulated protein